MRRAVWLLALGLAGAGTPAMAQDQSGVETLARILRAEDTRRFDENLFRQALAQPDSSLRSAAALGLGRLRDPGGVPLLLPLLLDPDTTVQVTAAFALGLIGDPAAVPALIARTRDPSPLSSAAAVELLAALNRIGGPEAAAFVAEVLAGSRFADRPDQAYLVGKAALDSWRLEKEAPVEALIGLLQDPSEDTRFAAVFSLSRLRTIAAAPRMLEALTDRSAAPVRAMAARTLTRAYADSARLEPGAVADLLVNATGDADAGVRISALRSLGTYAEPRLAARLVPLLEDAVPNVQVEAAATLGDLGPAPGSAEALGRILDGHGIWARRREALLSLARIDTAAFNAQVERWLAGSDWRDRAVAAAGLALVRPEAAERALADKDPRVVAAGLEAWGGALTAPTPAFLAACRRLARDADAALRAVALQGLARAPEPDDLPLLLASYAAASRDSFPDAELSALAAIVALGRSDPRGVAAVDRDALGTLTPPASYVVRRWAEQNWPAASRVWGPAFPLDAHRTLEDYRGVARRYLVGQLPDRYPRVKVDIEQLGTIELELFGPEAPLTVAHFLRLVDRHYFDGIRFHRVVPNFVVQGGDPRGDGWGGPGEEIRDEINTRRYKSYILGMALSGPDTGGSQFFITLSPQPHLDGSYTVFGQVTDGIPVLLRVTQGDRIRTIRQ